MTEVSRRLKFAPFRAGGTNFKRNNLDLSKSKIFAPALKGGFLITKVYVN
jgi:hypothetical protein